MKGIYYITLLGILAAAIWFYIDRRPVKFAETGEISALMVESGEPDEIGLEIHNGYMSILEEEGIPVKTIDPFSLLLLDPAKTARLHPAIIFPDENSQVLPADLGFWIRNYLDSGGNIMLAYDPGIYDQNNRYISPPLFGKLAGINYSLYPQLGKQAYTVGSISFRSAEAADFLQAPPGKLLNELTISSYKKERLMYPVAMVERMPGTGEPVVLADALIGETVAIPAVIRNTHGAGNVLYANLPLGHLKSRGSDDLLPRSFLRTFLVEMSKIPHVAPSPRGIGGIIINWHIDNHEERANIPYFSADGLLRADLPASIHITAGEFVTEPGDMMGFDACAAGREQVMEAMQFGIIGSHGGWRHNWFASAVDSGRFGRDEIAYYIRKNNDCLRSITGYPIVEYSAPNGVHPQPLATDILDSLGVIAYYYAGDSGSAPNRTFFNGRMVSGRVVAVPVMPFGTLASVQEMAWAEVSPDEFEGWLMGTLDFVVKHRSVRLIYSHLYDFRNNPQFIPPFKSFLEEIARLQSQKKVLASPMSVFADHLLRVVSTKAIFAPVGAGLQVRISNPSGLKGLCVEVPQKGLGLPEGGWFDVEMQGDWYRLCVTGDTDEASVVFPLAG